MNPNTNNTNNTNNNSTNTILFSIGAIALIGGGVALAAFLSQSNSNENNTSNNSSTTPTPTTASTNTSSPTASSTVTSTSVAVMQMYKNGSYTGSGTYSSPGGTEKVNLNVTLDNDIIKDISFDGETDNPTSRQYQNIFASNYKSLVVGKKIDDVQLSKVSGSSLTSSGFNAALTQIKSQAKN